MITISHDALPLAALSDVSPLMVFNTGGINSKTLSLNTAEDEKCNSLTSTNMTFSNRNNRVMNTHITNAIVRTRQHLYFGI